MKLAIPSIPVQQNLSPDWAIFTQYTNVSSLPGNFPAVLHRCVEQQNLNSKTLSLSLHWLRRGSFVLKATKS